MPARKPSLDDAAAKRAAQAAAKREWRARRAGGVRIVAESVPHSLVSEAWALGLIDADDPDSLGRFIIDCLGLVVKAAQARERKRREAVRREQDAEQQARISAQGALRPHVLQDKG